MYVQPCVKEGMGGRVITSTHLPSKLVKCALVCSAVRYQDFNVDMIFQLLLDIDI